MFLTDSYIMIFIPEYFQENMSELFFFLRNIQQFWSKVWFEKKYTNVLIMSPGEVFFQLYWLALPIWNPYHVYFLQIW